jgi:hypothetical protein
MDVQLRDSENDPTQGHVVWARSFVDKGYRVYEVCNFLFALARRAGCIELLQRQISQFGDVVLVRGDVDLGGEPHGGL